MSTEFSVEVFLGNPIEIPSEKQFLARLLRDMRQQGAVCRIFGNLHVGRAACQVDFVVVTEHRTVLVELKTFPGPVVAAPKNGDWQVRVGAEDVRDFGNPAWQAQQATFALSDELHFFAADEAAPGPSRHKFYRDIDTVVCAFPALPDGSCAGEMPFVTVLGYADLLERVQRSGRRVAWADSDWDAFGRRLNLYRADDDSQEGVVRRAGAAAVDAYRGLYLRAHSDLPPLVNTAVRVAGTDAPRPDLPSKLTKGRAVLLHAPSEFGKTLWARSTGAELAGAGEIPIWLATETCEMSFRTSLARAISPYTSLSPDELLRAADAAGRVVVFIIDDLTRAPDAVRQAVLAGAQAVRLRHRTCGLLMTAQSADAASSVPDTDVELLAPADSERQALLDAYGAPDIIDRCDAFRSPLELSLAAASASTLPPEASAAELLDVHIDRLVAGDDRLRNGIRTVARIMHNSVTPAPRRPDLARELRRNHAMTDTELQALWSCPLLTVAHGRVSFRHERFEHFLAAESLVIETADIETLARMLNQPRCATLRADAVALERDERRVSEILIACEHSDLLFAAATGRLGVSAAIVTETILTDALNAACAQTTKGDATFDAGADFIFGGQWTLPDGPAAHAHLATIGRLLTHGHFVDSCARLLDSTDALCARLLDEAHPASSAFADRMFAATYALGGRNTLPATTLVRSAVEGAMFNRDRPETAEVALELMRGRGDDALGRLYVAAEFIRRGTSSSILTEVIVGCLEARRYHLRLLGLQLAHTCGRSLDGQARQQVLDAVHALPTDNLAISSSVVETLSALGDLAPVRNIEDITEEIQMVLGMRDDPLGRKMAYGIISSQFDADVIGPYYEAVAALSDTDRQRLLAIALYGGETDSMSMGWILGEIKDLANPLTRSAVERYVARADPSTWFSSQEGMDGIVRALQLLVADDIPLPDPVDSGAADPAWRASLALVMSSLADADTPQPVERTWAALLDCHRDVVASLLLNLRQMWGLHATGLKNPQDVHDRLLATMPAAGLSVLIWSLEHPNRIRSLSRYDHGSRDYLVGMLGRIGDRRASEALRRLIDDPAIGEAAAAAVRAIEMRDGIAAS
ncbi:MAG: nuclease-related domain-containing protein [Solirubrobacteraceae bacterium]